MKRLFWLLFLSTSIFMTQCNRRRIINNGCLNQFPMQASIDSFTLSHQFIDNQSFGRKDSGKQYELGIFITPMIKLKDTTKFPNSCTRLKFTDTIEDMKIYNLDSISETLPANTDITSYFRKVNEMYSIEKPYYMTIPQYLKEFQKEPFFNEVQNIKIIIADSMPIGAGPVSSRLQFVIKKKRANIIHTQVIKTSYLKFLK